MLLWRPSCFLISLFFSFGRSSVDADSFWEVVRIVRIGGEWEALRGSYGYGGKWITYRPRIRDKVTVISALSEIKEQ